LIDNSNLTQEWASVNSARLTDGYGQEYNLHNNWFEMRIITNTEIV